MVSAAALNIFLNYIMVPAWGIKGAAVATLISCSVQIILSLFFSLRYLKLKFEVGRYLIYCFSAAIMFIAIKYLPINFQVNLFSLIFKIILGGGVYLVFILILDKGLRRYVGTGCQIFKEKMSFLK